MPIHYASLDRELKDVVRSKLTHQGATWYVHATNGSDGDTGKTWDSAFLTMQQAFDNLSSGDTIIFAGKIKEQLTTPVQVFDVTIIGSGNRPRHADDAPTPVGGKTSATWTYPTSPTAATPLLKVMQQGWRFVNILWAGVTTANDGNACVQLYRDAEADDAERDASHAEFIDCRFASGYHGIRDTGGCYGVLVKGNRFSALEGYCILGVGNIGQGQTQWVIEDNHFSGFTNGAKIAAFECRIKGNTFSDGGTPNTTVVLNTNNGGGANNFVIDNAFQTATANFNTPDVVGTSTDVWFNISIDATSAGVGGNYEAGQPA